MIFGHSQGFIKNCSPWLSSLWAQMVLSEDMFSFRIETHGEQIIENACLYPITFKYIENHGELILKKCLLCPTPEYLWGTIMKNPLLCPNATPQGQPSARAKGETSPQGQPNDRAKAETSPQARQRSAQARRLTPGRAREYARKSPGIHPEEPGNTPGRPHSPVASSMPSMMFMFWTAAPEAPLPRLSKSAVTLVWSS